MARKKQAADDVWDRAAAGAGIYARVSALCQRTHREVRARFGEPPLLDGYTDKLGGHGLKFRLRWLVVRGFFEKSAVAWRVIGERELVAA